MQTNAKTLTHIATFGHYWLMSWTDMSNLSLQLPKQMLPTQKNSFYLAASLFTHSICSTASHIDPYHTFPCNRSITQSSLHDWVVYYNSIFFIESDTYSQGSKCAFSSWFSACFTKGPFSFVFLEWSICVYSHAWRQQQQPRRWLKRQRWEQPCQQTVLNIQTSLPALSESMCWGLILLIDAVLWSLTLTVFWMWWFCEWGVLQQIERLAQRQAGEQSRRCRQGGRSVEQVHWASILNL